MKIPKWGMVAAVLLMALPMLLMVVPAGASPGVYSCNFFGTAKVDGLSVGAGTEITAWLGASQVASAFTGDGSLDDDVYSLTVELDEAYDGATINFKIGALWASETGTWKKMWFDPIEVNLTATTGDTTPPTVVSTSPVDGATGVPVNTVVTATFSEPIDVGTIVFTLDSVAGSVSYADTTATFDPIANLAYSTTYTASIHASDLADNPMAAPYTWIFTTQGPPVGPPPVAPPDTTPPTVISTWPKNSATDVAVGTSVTATFSEPIDEATLVFTLDNVVGNVSYNPVATFNPIANLGYSTTYTASIQASDLAGNPMAAAFIWNFTTEEAPAEVPAKPVSPRLSVRNLRIIPDRVYLNQPVTIYVDVANSGDRRGSKVVDLMINGESEQSTRVGVNPHSVESVSFTVYRTNPGQYSVFIEGVSGWFVVGELQVASSGPSDEGLDTGDIIAIVVIAIILIAGITVAFVYARRSA